MKNVYKGAFCVTLTAFKKNGDYDEERMRSHISRVIENGVDGITTLGSTGQVAYLTDEEKKKVIVDTIDEANGRVPVFVGSVHPSTRGTIYWSQFAQDAGAEGLQIACPYYGTHTDEALYQHFKKVAESVEIPVMLYNNIDISGNDLQPEVVARLAEIDNIDYIKECVSTSRMQDIRELCGDKIVVFSGSDEFVFEGFKLGVVGVISGGANAFPKLVKKIYTLIWENKDIEAAKKIWDRYMPIAKIFETPKVWISYLAAACEIVGEPMGPRRLPLLPISENEKSNLAKLIENLGEV